MLGFYITLLYICKNKDNVQPTGGQCPKHNLQKYKKEWENQELKNYGNNSPRQNGD